MKVGLASVVLGMSLGSAAVASAKQPCPVEGESCEIELLPGTCVLDEDDQLSCVADSATACPQYPQTGCVVFEVGAGTCAAFFDGTVCVPNATDTACTGVALRGACVLPTGDAGVCVPSNGLLACVEDADGCLLADQDSGCDTAEGLRGWCRRLNEGVPGCTTACVDASEGLCRDAAGALGSCDESTSGDVVCIADPSLCAEHGDVCEDAAGQSSTCVYSSSPDDEGNFSGLICGDECGGCPTGQVCRITGGAGGVSCEEPGEDDSSGCCLGSQEVVTNDRYRGPATMALSALAMTLMGRRKRRAKR